MNTKPVFATHRGDFDMVGAFFRLGPTPVTAGEPIHSYDLGRCHLQDLRDPAIVEKFLGEALKDTMSKPLTPKQRGILMDRHEEMAGLQNGKLSMRAQPCNFIKQLFEEIPQLRDNSMCLLSGVLMHDADGAEHAYISNYNSVRNWRGELPAAMRQNFDQVEMAPDEARDKAYAIIHLANDEWDSSVMWMAALEHFAKNPDCRFVEVIEHAGWRLGYCRDDAQIWTTANDAARLNPATPQPKDFSGVVIRRQESTAALLREIHRHMRQTLCTDPILLCDYTHPQGFTKSGWRIDPKIPPVAGTVVKLDGANGEKIRVRQVINPLSEEERRKIAAQDELFRQNLLAVGEVTPDRVKEFTWQDNGPCQNGRSIWHFASQALRMAVSATMAKHQLRPFLRLTEGQRAILDTYRSKEGLVSCSGPETVFLGGDDNDLACTLSTIARQVRASGDLVKAYAIDSAAPAGFFNCTWAQYHREFASLAKPADKPQPAMPPVLSASRLSTAGHGIRR